MTTEEAIRLTMACARQLVQSYGGTTISQVDRDNLCRAMTHYEEVSIKQLKKSEEAQ